MQAYRQGARSLERRAVGRQRCRWRYIGSWQWCRGFRHRDRV